MKTAFNVVLNDLNREFCYEGVWEPAIPRADNAAHGQEMRRKLRMVFTTI